MDNNYDSKSLLGDLKSQTSSGKLTSTGYQVNETFRVKLSEYPKLSGKGYEWNSFRESFEATVESVGLGKLLIYDTSNEEYHQEKRDYDMEYNSKVNKFHNILKKVVANGSVKSKVRKFDKTIDVVVSYLYLRKHYEIDGDKHVYGHNQLEDLLQLELHYNSLGGFDKYLSNFKDMCHKLEECGQGLSYDQQHTFSDI